MRWCDVAHVPELLLVHRADVARLVQARRVREVRDHERDDMAGRGERPGVDPVLVGEFLESPARQALDDLLQDGVYSLARCFAFGFHGTRIVYEEDRAEQRALLNIRTKQAWRGFG